MKAIMLLLIAMLATAVKASLTPSQFIETALHGNKIDYQHPLHQQIDIHQSPATCEEEAEIGSFSLYDYAVVIAMLVISLGIGIFYGFFDKKPSERRPSMFMLGTEMTIFPVTLSLATSFITAIELLGNPAEIFFNGGQFSLIVVSMLLVIPLAVQVFFPIYDKMKLTSCYEYLGMRFGKEMRVFGGGLYIAQMCFYTSVSVLAPAIALSKATGLNTRLAIVLIYVVCIFYSSQGGLKAVVIADTFQACVFVLSLILVLVVGTYMQEGGIRHIFSIANERKRLELFNFDPDPTSRHTVFSVVIGGFFYWASLLCVNQATVQKAMSLRSLAKAKIAITLSILGLATVFLLNFYTGIMTFAKYEKCDPLKAGKIDAIDQLMPFYVMETFGHLTTFVGIFVAGIFAASLGTVAACLSSLSAVTIGDILITGLNINIPSEKATGYAKWMNFGYGVISFGLIFMVERMNGVLQATLTLNGLIGGILLGLFCLGIFFKSANLKGALYGGLLSTISVLTLGIFALVYSEDEPHLKSSIDGCSCSVNTTMAPIINELDDDDGEWYTAIYKISYMWYSMVGTLLTIFYGLLISQLANCFERGKPHAIVDEKQEHKEIESRFTSRSTSLASDRRTSTHSASSAQRMSSVSFQSPSENKITEASHQPPHYHHNDDRLFIISEETISADQERKNGTSIIGLFEGQRQGIDNKALDISDEMIRQK